MDQPLFSTLRYDPFLHPDVVFAIWERGKLVGSCGPLCYAQQQKLCACACEGRHHGLGIQTARRMAFAHVLAIGLNAGIEAVVTNDYILAEVDNRQFYARTTL
jgi:hypothetical protein